MKPLIISVIRSDGNIRKTLELLKAGELGAILRRYEELFRSRTGKTIENDEILKEVLIGSPWKIKGGLQAWVSSDLWHCVVKETGRQPDETEFNISLYEALDELQLSGAIIGRGFQIVKPVKPMKLPLVEMREIKPKTMRW